MMTNRRAFPISSTLFVVGMLVAVLLSLSSNLLAQTAAGYSETPDPYFQSTPTRRPDPGNRQAPNLKKPIKVDSPTIGLPVEAPQLWMTPETTTSVDDAV